eukprot:scaffold18420_cov67-Isochrysis_galbana.AAC.1
MASAVRTYLAVEFWRFSQSSLGRVTPFYITPWGDSPGRLRRPCEWWRDGAPQRSQSCRPPRLSHRWPPARGWGMP